MARTPTQLQSMQQIEWAITFAQTDLDTLTDGDWLKFEARLQLFLSTSGMDYDFPVGWFGGEVIYKWAVRIRAGLIERFKHLVATGDKGEKSQKKKTGYRLVTAQNFSAMDVPIQDAMLRVRAFYGETYKQHLR